RLRRGLPLGVRRSAAPAAGRVPRRPPGPRGGYRTLDRVPPGRWRRRGRGQLCGGGGGRGLAEPQRLSDGRGRPPGGRGGGGGRTRPSGRGRRRGRGCGGGGRVDGGSRGFGCG